MSDEVRLQSLQRGPNGRIFQVEAHLHADSNQYIVFWEDILEAFPGATNVLNGTVIVTRARDVSLRLIDPKCIKYHPGKVLEVVGGEELSTSQVGSTYVPAPMPLRRVYSQKLTRQNIEQWAAMTITEEMVTGGIYAPTICTLTTTESHSFKPLLVRTEADASSIRANSTRCSDKELTEDSTQEGDADSGDDKAVENDKEGDDNTYFPIATSPSRNSIGISASDPFASPPLASAHNTNISNFETPTHSQQTPSGTIPSHGSTDPLNDLTMVNSLFNGASSGDGGMFIGTLAINSGNGGPTSPTSLSPTSNSHTSLAYPTTPPSTRPKKSGFIKSTFDHLPGRQLASPLSPTATVETHPYQPVFLFPSHLPVEPLLTQADLLFSSTQDTMMPYRPPPPSDFDLQQDNREWQWRDRIGWVAFQPSFAPGAPIDYGTPAEDVKDEEGSEEDVIDYDALFQKIEAERARRVHERQKALDESVRPKSFVEEADTHVVPYPLPPGVVASTLAKDL